MAGVSNFCRPCNGLAFNARLRRGKIRVPINPTTKR
nr:MAG TPA: Protein of unknown function (DUF1244) [Siphoviridae sp. ctJJg9]